MPAERKRSNNSAGIDSRIFPMEGAGETRTPMAWQQRNLNYQQQQQQQTQQIYHASTIGYDRERPKRVSNSSSQAHAATGRVSEEVQTMGRGRRSSSSTATSSSSSTERASKNSRPAPHSAPHSTPHGAPPPLPAYQQAYVTTWDGEPCPIHHLTMVAPQQRVPPPQMQMMMPTMATLPRRPPAYDKNVVMLLPPMMRPRPLVMPAAEGPPEPLPMRDPKAITATLPRKEGSAGSEKSHHAVKENGCHGHTVVLWFIITVITIGVLLGAVLRFVMG